MEVGKTGLILRITAKSQNLVLRISNAYISPGQINKVIGVDDGNNLHGQQISEYRGKETLLKCNKDFDIKGRIVIDILSKRLPSLSITTHKVVNKASTIGDHFLVFIFSSIVILKWE